MNWTIIGILGLVFIVAVQAVFIYNQIASTDYWKKSFADVQPIVTIAYQYCKEYDHPAPDAAYRTRLRDRLIKSLIAYTNKYPSDGS